MVHEILNQVERYLSGMVSFRDLENWVAARIQDAYDSGDQRAIVLIDSIDVALMRASDKQIDEWDLHRELARLTRMNGTYIVPAAQATNITTATGSSTLHTCHDERRTRDYYLQVAAVAV